MAERPRTLVEKIWDEHVVSSDPGAPAILAVDLHLVHEVTSPQAFTGLRERGLKVRKPGQTLATADHSIPTTDPSIPITDELARKQLAQIEENCREFGIPFLGKGSPDPWHRPRHRAGARPHAAGHDHRLRRLPHGHARRLRSAGIRHRDERDRDGPGHADTAAAQAQDVPGPDRRAAQPGRRRQGHHPRPDRPYRHRRRHRPRHRIHRRRDPRPVDGRADDGLQHVDRGRRPGRARSPRTKPRSPTCKGRKFAPQGAAWDEAVARWRKLPTRRRRGLRPNDRRSTATSSSRWSPTAPTPAWAFRSRAACPP